MIITDPVDKTLKDFKGLHLYHINMSMCVERVRLLIEEKQLPWTSHYVDLATKENLTPEYFAINPKGVVPTVILDGEVVIESNDIMLYLEERFPEPVFMPKAESEKEEVRAWLKRSKEGHIPGIKTHNYNRFLTMAREARDERQAKLVQSMEWTEDDVKLYKGLQKDPEHLAFHAKHEPGKIFPQEDVDNALIMLMQSLADMDAAIARGGWLVGDSYTLADMSWVTSVRAFSVMGLPVDEFQHVMGWFERIEARPAWERAINAWYGPKPEQRVFEVRH